MSNGRFVTHSVTHGERKLFLVTDCREGYVSLELYENDEQKKPTRVVFNRSELEFVADILKRCYRASDAM